MRGNAPHPPHLSFREACDEESKTPCPQPRLKDPSMALHDGEWWEGREQCGAGEQPAWIPLSAALRSE